MKTLTTIDLTKEGEPTYKTYFYHKLSSKVYEVITNGYACTASIRCECGISKDLNWGSTLPKYILKQLNK